ncbi:MAG: ABC transporter substrate-binding protein [Variibacter sp.]|nr:ABC transporter substrate-binding protein [Variibacter sp.]
MKTTAAAGAASIFAPPLRLASAQSGPIRIGLMAPLTGVVAAGGRECVDGFNLFWDQVGKTVAGRELDISLEDDGSNPDMALQKARRLVEQRNVHLLYGNLIGNTGLAVAEYAKNSGVPYLMPIIGVDDMTQRKRIPNVVRIAGAVTGSQPTRPLADFALKKGLKRAITISADYAYGHEQCGGFVQTFSENGGQVLQQFWHPLNTADFSPYIIQIQNLNPDVVFAMEAGADANRFFSQWKNFGLQGKIALYGGTNTPDQAVIRTAGAECEGIISAAQFTEGADIPASKAFVEAYEKKYGKIPGAYALTFYAGAMWVREGLTALKGNVEDRKGLLDAMSKVVLKDSPLGRPVQLDSYGNPILDIYIRQVKKRADGKWWNVVVETYPQVSQFWNYDPKKYLEQPTYSREFQGQKKS